MAGDAVVQSDGCAHPGVTGQMEEEKNEGGSAEEDEREEDKEEGDEARASVGKRSPKDPTRKQREDHERMHMPYRSWCEDCVRSRARNAPHHKQAPEDPLEEIIRCRECIWTTSLCPEKTQQPAATHCW